MIQSKELRKRITDYLKTVKTYKHSYACKYFNPSVSGYGEFMANIYLMIRQLSELLPEKNIKLDYQ